MLRKKQDETLYVCCDSLRFNDHSAAWLVKLRCSAPSVCVCVLFFFLWYCLSNSLESFRHFSMNVRFVSILVMSVSFTPSFAIRFFSQYIWLAKIFPVNSFVVIAYAHTIREIEADSHASK